MQPPPIRSLYADDPEMTELVRQFVGNLAGRMASMEAAWGNSQEPLALQRLAHQLRGAAGGYGFPSLTEAAGRLEEAMKESRTAEARKALDDLEELCRRASAGVVRD